MAIHVGIAAGFITDAIGRRLCILGTMVINATFGLLTSVAPTPGLIMGCRIGCGIGVGGAVPAVFSLAAEYAPRSQRGFLINIVCAFWMVGSIWTAASAWFILSFSGASWRLFAVTSACPSLLCFLLTALLLPESPRWLAQQGREADAMASLRSMAANRKTCLNGVELECIREEKGDALNAGELWRQIRKLFAPKLIRNTTLLLVMTALLQFGWFGLVTWIPSLFQKVGFNQGSVYSSALLVSAATIPGNIASALLADRPGVGRRRLFCGSMFAAAALALVFAFSHTTWLTVAAAMGFNMVSVGGWNSLECLTAESFPTEVRGVASGLLHSIGRVASALAQLANGFLIARSTFLLLLITAGTMLVGTCAGLLLPKEMANASLARLLTMMWTRRRNLSLQTHKRWQMYRPLWQFSHMPRSHGGVINKIIAA